MKKTFFKNLFRDIKKTFSRFISIAIIITIGVAFYAGVRAASPDLKLSGDYYFNRNNLMDFKIMSTLGLTNDDLEEMQKQKGVKKVEGSYSKDAVTQIKKHQMVLNINSLPDKGGINSILMVKGRRPNKDDEAVVEDKFLKQNNLKIGDTLVLESGNDTNLSDDLKHTKFKITGTAESPLYVSQQRQLSSIGNGLVKGFVYVLPDVFKSDVYTEAYVLTNSSESKKSIMDGSIYEDDVKSVQNELKKIGPSRNEIRYNDVLKTASEKINDAETKLAASKKEAEEKFSSAQSEIDSAKAKIAKGKAELLKNESAFNAQMADGQKQIDDGKKQISSAESTLNDKQKELDSAKAQLLEGQKKLDESEAALNVGKDNAASQISSGVYNQVLKLSSDPMSLYQYNALKNIYESDISGKDFDSMYSLLKKDNAIGSLKTYFDIESLKDNFDNSEAQIKSGRLNLSNNEKTIQDGQNELNNGMAELNERKSQIADAQDKLNKGKEEGLSKLQKGKKDIEDGENTIYINEGKLKSEEEKFNSGIKDGENEIQKNKSKLDEIKKPEWYVLTRSQNIGYETYSQDSERINSIGKVFPLIFFLVASLVSLTTMTRMVQEKRTEAGTFRAIGYSGGSIVFHYLIYSFLASIIGSIFGVMVGFRLFPYFIMHAYGSLYTMPYSIALFNTGIALQASLVAVLFTCTASIAAVLSELREVPASLMRPKPPKSGSRIWLEHISFLWKKLSFTRKVTARNIFRYKQRFFMTIVGIAACTGLMITGFGLKQAIVGAAKVQFDIVYKYDVQGNLTKVIGETDKNDIKKEALKDSNIKSLLFAYSKNVTAKLNSSSTQDAYIVVPENKSLIKKYINLAMNGKELKLDDTGVILTQKLSKILNKKAGDTIEINLNDKIVKLRVSGVTEHYVQHYIYMSPAYYKKVTGENVSFNSFYGLLKNTSETVQDNTSDYLKKIKYIDSVSFKNNVSLDFNKSVNSTNMVIVILTVSAGVLAFVVMYNLTNINISERKRELATIKLLGFYDHELAAYIYRENMILTVMGSLIGIPVGVLIDMFVISSAETNVIMFLRKISPVYFVYSILLTVLFAVIVNLAMYKRFDKIDMIESLKSAE